jgi:hypothetical protein
MPAKHLAEPCAHRGSVVPGSRFRNRIERPLHFQLLYCIQDLGRCLIGIVVRVFHSIEIPAFIHVDQVARAEVVDVAEIPRGSSLHEGCHLRCDVVAKRLDLHGWPSRLDRRVEEVITGSDLQRKNLPFAIR